MVNIKQLVRERKRKRVNRAYYDGYWNIKDIRTAGVVQAPEKTQLERVQLDQGLNELVYLFGFGQGQARAHFNLRLSIVSLFPNGHMELDGASQPLNDAPKDSCESRWRLAKLDFKLVLANEDEDLGKNYLLNACADEDDRDVGKKQAPAVTVYSYSREQLIDYEEKRKNASKHESRNVYKVGALQLEQVLPFSFARILFNGLMEVRRSDGSLSHEPMRLSISTHPTCDKFDYAYNFNTQHTVNIVSKSTAANQSSDQQQRSSKQALDQVLENRFDQPLMFQGHLESLQAPGCESESDAKRTITDKKFVMWGAKVKKLLDLKQEAVLAGDGRERECLFAWTEFGQQIHLSRPVGRPNLVYGLVHGSYDYASRLYDAQLLKDEVGVEKQVDFSELDSFAELTSSLKIQLRAFKCKTYTLEFIRPPPTSASSIDGGDLNSAPPVFKIKINGFPGWAMRVNLALGQQLRFAQHKLLTMAIDEPALSFKLADERLLGGKGMSLVQLAELVRCKQLASTRFSSSAPRDLIEVSVPRGLVITTRAYLMWLSSDSSGELGQALEELDSLRRKLAAKSIHLNPMASEHVPLSRAQALLREKCAQTCEKLRSKPLPNKLKNLISAQLRQIFGDAALLSGTKTSTTNDDDEAEGGDNEKSGDGLAFAVRSSAVGEDSLETSAAGQMRTILGARGLPAIHQAIVDCWASQFEMEALTYKSQNGLSFNLPMAVVVQELVACHAAGVAATCDPLTGNKRRLEITANLGLGEGVVAGERTDSVRVNLEALQWDPARDEHTPGAQLSLPEHARHIEKISGSAAGSAEEQPECCLSDAQIIALANLLLELRLASAISEREVEWGLTLEAADETASSSSSSSSSSEGGGSFRLHLLQSRPLTHLQRLTTREIDHELDWGLPCARDVVSRANLGEVMPGALCPLNSTYSLPITGSYATKKPFERHHTRKIFVGDAFAFHAQMAMMVVTYTDTLKRFMVMAPEDRETAKAVIYSMIGSTFYEPETEAERELMTKFQMEKINPLALNFRRSLIDILALDGGLYSMWRKQIERKLDKLLLTQDLPKLDSIEPTNLAAIHKQIRLLYKRIITSSGPFCDTWVAHIQATLLSMTMNVICLKMMSTQAAYASSSDNLIATEILNDFSVLMREPIKIMQDGKARPSKSNSLGTQTESGDIAKLLEQLLECIVEENLLERLQSLEARELYDFFTNQAEDEKSKELNFKCRRMFNDFMLRNGHRAYREFCFSTVTWSDDSSYIIRLLAMRLKKFTREQVEVARARRLEGEREHAHKYAQVEAKINAAKFALMSWAVPRARNATKRRERSKSLLIRATHSYRLAFRHLGGLLCLAGLLPSADLIFYLAIEELDELISTCCNSSGDVEQLQETRRNALMPRLLYKARRRQQRARAYDNVKFPTPNLTVNEMFRSLEEQVAPQQTVPNTTKQQLDAPAADSTNINSANTTQVSGLISCAGLVTGRACVISSLEQADQIEQGDILITYSIDISWSVHFFALAGIVTEVGGIVSHGAVVAREYGIPTLCTAIGACAKFATGQRVTLDATRGLCYLTPAEDDAAANDLTAPATPEQANGTHKQGD